MTIDSCRGQIHPLAPRGHDCPDCVRAHREQREHDAAIVAERRLHSLRSTAGKANGARYGRKPALPANRGTCGHPTNGNRIGKHRCLRCEREAKGRTIETPKNCSVCGAPFVRRWPAQQRCEAHARLNQRRKLERHASFRAEAVA